jgi:hypothetical protein
MRSIARILAASLLALTTMGGTALVAQEDAPGSDPLAEGLNLFEQGADLFLRGLLDEIGPQLEQLRPQFEGMADEIGPMIAGLLNLVDEIDAYHPPEILPNGDIILRRKTPSKQAPEPRNPPGEGEVDL